MFRDILNNITPRSFSDSPEFVRSIDQFDAQSFNQNDAGWLRNDISQLARATSQSQYDAIMRRLVELKQSGGLPDDLSKEDAIAMIKPRWAQSPNELEEFMAMTNDDFMARMTKAYEKAVKDNPPKDITPAPESAPATE